MCVICTAEPGSMPSASQLAQMSDTNHDGAGIAWHDGTRLHRYRNPDNHQTLAFIIRNWEAFMDMPCLIHFRLATHGSIHARNTHPFAFRKGQRTGYIAHNGIARAYTAGRYESDSRNAIDAWQNGHADLTDGSQGQFALIDQNGDLEWLTNEHQTIQGQKGHINVSNLLWDDPYASQWDDLYAPYYGDEWISAYEEGYADAQAELAGIPDYQPR